MNNGQALLKLIEALQVIGIDQENFNITQDEKTGDIEVSIKRYPRAKLVIVITHYWRFPGVPCYFVNYNHECGAFSANEGTPHLLQAIFNLGNVMRYAGNIATKED